MSGTGQVHGAKDGDEGAFGDASAVPGHDAYEDDDGSQIKNGEGEEGHACSPADDFGGTGLAGRDGDEFHAAEGVDGESDGEKRSGESEGKKATVLCVLRRNAAAEEQAGAQSDEDGNDGNLDHGKPEFEASVAVDIEKVDSQEKHGKYEDPEQRRDAWEPKLCVGGGGDHFGADGHCDGNPVAHAGDEAGPAVEVEGPIDSKGARCGVSAGEFSEGERDRPTDEGGEDKGEDHGGSGEFDRCGGA